MEEAQKVDLITLLRTFKKEGLDNFIVIRKEKFENNFIPKSLVKEKIEELDIQISECEYADDDIEERKQDIEKEKRLLLRDKKTLQELLGEE